MNKYIGPGICVLIALVLFLSSVVLPTGASMKTAEPVGRTCADAGGQWGFQRGVGIGCFTPDGHLLAFVND
jgi:hypothetical protein